MLKIHVLPLHQHAVLQPLPRVHTDIEDDLDLLFVEDAVSRIVQHFPDLFFLFAGKGDAPDGSILLLTLLSHQDFQGEGISVFPVFLQRGKDFPQPYDFPVVCGHRNLRSP